MPYTPQIFAILAASLVIIMVFVFFLNEAETADIMNQFHELSYSTAVNKTRVEENRAQMVRAGLFIDPTGAPELPEELLNVTHEDISGTNSPNASSSENTNLTTYTNASASNIAETIENMVGANYMNVLGKNVIQFFQNGSPAPSWGHLKPKGASWTLRESGCAITSLAIIVSNMTQQVIDPGQMLEIGEAENYYDRGMMNQNTWDRAAARYGFQSTGLTVIKGVDDSKWIEAMDILRNGGYVMIRVLGAIPQYSGGGSGTTSSGGHFTVLSNIDSQGRLYFADTAWIDLNTKSFSQQEVINFLNAGASGGNLVAFFH